MQFSFSNVIPQNYYNNGGIWNTFERFSRHLIENDTCSSVEIISGPIYLNSTPNTNQNALTNTLYSSKLIVLKENGIPIPEKLFKIIQCNAKDGQHYFNAF